MGPVGGGRLGVRNALFEALTPTVRRVPELALRFVLKNPHVSVALSGMSTLEQVEENLRVASDSVSLSATDEQLVREHLQRLQKMADLYCTGCRYCLPCEQGVNIPAIFEQFNLARVYGLWEHGRRSYRRMLNNKKGADVCAACGECEARCPQNIPIREQLKEAHAALTSPATPPGSS
jgi:predicted aldo/keto reductase-like oxidoreductase